MADKKENTKTLAQPEQKLNLQDWVRLILPMRMRQSKTGKYL